jgi:hypothetical protein
LDLVFEHLALSHQVMVMRRARRRAQFSGADRCFWILLSALWDRWPKSLNIAKPATVLRWRREGLWKVWRKGKRKRRPGRPPLDAQLVSLIGQMSRSNLLWGAPRIHGELLKLGLKVSQATVAKYMVPLRLRRGPSWRVFLRNELAGLRANGLIVELKEACDELRALGPWSQGSIAVRRPGRWLAQEAGVRFWVALARDGHPFSPVCIRAESQGPIPTTGSIPNVL